MVIQLLPERTEIQAGSRVEEKRLKSGLRIGEVTKARDIGKPGHDSYVWHACIHCGRTRWVELRKGKPRSSVCVTCGNTLRVKESGSQYRDRETARFAPRPVMEKRENPKPITFRCKFCGQTNPLDDMAVLTRFFPPLVACKKCEREWS